MLVLRRPVPLNGIIKLPEWQSTHILHGHKGMGAYMDMGDS